MLRKDSAIEAPLSIYIAPKIVTDGELVVVALKEDHDKKEGEEDDDDEEDGDDDDDDDDGNVQGVPIPYDQMVAYDPSFRKSPYEIRFPSYCLPSWARKVDKQGQSQISTGNHICYVHVGKAAGSSIGCTLGFGLHCHNDMPRPNGLLSLFATNVFHNDVNDCTDDTPYNLYNVRHPLERAKSAYVYDRIDVEDDEHKEDELYVKCGFWTINDLAERGLAKDGEASNECKEMAYQTVRGHERHGSH
jgi:hypothetical protein